MTRTELAVDNPFKLSLTEIRTSYKLLGLRLKLGKKNLNLSFEMDFNSDSNLNECSPLLVLETFQTCHSVNKLEADVKELDDDEHRAADAMTIMDKLSPAERVRSAEPTILTTGGDAVASVTFTRTDELPHRSKILHNVKVNLV
jgi:hypothetical protein